MPDPLRPQPASGAMGMAVGLRGTLMDAEGPLALVMEHKPPASPPKVRLTLSSSPGRSSGFSDHHSSPSSSPARAASVADHNSHSAAHSATPPVAHCHENDPHPEEPTDADEAPLALVVEKKGRSDSGHDDDFRSRSGTGSSFLSEALSGTGRTTASESLVLPPGVSLRASQEASDAHRADIRPDVTIARVVRRESLSAVDMTKPSSAIKIKDFARLVAAADVDEDEELDEDDMCSETSSSLGTWTGSSVDAAADMAEMHLGNGVTLHRVTKSANGEIVYPCDFCDKTFANRYHLQSHVVIHTGERNFYCRKCNKAFARKSTLRAHMTTHTKTSNFMCPVCEKACNDNQSLEEHIRIHTGEKPFVCSVCSKAYARKSHLSVHYRVHTGERPFVCDDCGKDFTEKRFLNDHIGTAHTGVEGPLKCPNCAREFAYKTSLKQHLKKQMCAKNVAKAAAIAMPHAQQQQLQQQHQHEALLEAAAAPPLKPASVSNGSAANMPKQFQCPFCEKSYSWKQTLKQHVSMYHRNKVHTDEFWKYELAKHRRLDCQSNEDLWKEQLGRHAAKAAAVKEEAGVMSACSVASVTEQQQPAHWMDHIRKSTLDTHSSAQVSAEMKLLALQSLIRMGLNPFAQEESQSQQLPPPQPQSVVLRPEPLPLMEVEAPRSLVGLKEEPAAKRTQMWLAQLGKYRQQSLQDELDRSHEELWEQQIARVRQHPVRSPLEPEEIVIDDEAAEAASRPAAAAVRMMSALEVRCGKPASASRPPPSATITRPPTDAEQMAAPVMPKPNYPEVVAEELPPPAKKMTLPLEHNLNLDLGPPPAAEKEDDIPEEEDSSVAKDSSSDASEPSFLKSLLLDRHCRKRSALQEAVAVPAAASAASAEDASCHDILRRRLLGLKDPEPAVVATDNTKKEESADKQQQDSLSKKDPLETYAHTSVLKHLLYRYNNLTNAP